MYRDPWISRASRGVRAGLVAREGRVLVRVTVRVQFVGSSRRVSRLRPSRIGTRVPRLARARVPLRCRTSSRRITRRSVLQTRVRTSRVRTPWRAPGFPRSTRGARTRRRCETFEPNSSRHPAKRRILLLLLPNGTRDRSNPTVSSSTVTFVPGARTCARCGCPAECHATNRELLRAKRQERRECEAARTAESVSLFFIFVWAIRLTCACFF